MSDAAGKKGFPLEVYISSPALLDLLSAFNYIQTDSKSQDAPPFFRRISRKCRVPALRPAAEQGERKSTRMRISWISHQKIHFLFHIYVSVFSDEVLRRTGSRPSSRRSGCLRYQASAERSAGSPHREIFQRVPMLHFQAQ